MITIKVDPKSVLNGFSLFQDQQAPFAVSRALNRIANAGQSAEQAHMRESFHLRRESFVIRGVKIDKADRATKSSWRVVIQLAYPDQRHFMDEHEQGGERQRFGGGRLWKPNPEVFKSKIIGRSNPLHPSMLHLHKDAKGRIIGDQRTFLIKTKGNGKMLVLQRQDRGLDGRTKRGLKTLTLDNIHVGMGPRMKREREFRRTNGTRLLYMLVSRVRIPAKLEFVTTISKVVNEQLEPMLRQSFDEAVRDA